MDFEICALTLLAVIDDQSSANMSPILGLWGPQVGEQPPRGGVG